MGRRDTSEVREALEEGEEGIPAEEDEEVEGIGLDYGGDEEEFEEKVATEAFAARSADAVGGRGTYSSSSSFVWGAVVVSGSGCISWGCIAWSGRLVEE